MLFKENGLTFKIDPTSLTAEVIKSPEAKGNIFIPRSIMYQSQHYNVTSIQPKSFKDNNHIISIDFPEDSAIRKITNKAFLYSSIERITIPASLDDLEEGWCDELKYLTHISISPGNKRYKFLNDDKNIIIGKSDLNSGIYDTLVFARRDISKVFIPSFIKHISSSAFSYCRIKIFEYDENSQLETIGKKVFHFSDIQNIFIPAKLKYVDKGWLGQRMISLKITISPQNKVFKYIDGEMIVAKSNPEEDNFDVLVFADCNIKHATIPSSIKTINSYSFFNCQILNSIEFSEGSELTSIHKCAFCWTNIHSITFPSNLTYIGKEAFSDVTSLETVNFPENSKLKIIKKKAFSESEIKSFTITSEVEKIDGIFNFVCNLNKFFIPHINQNIKFLDSEEKIVVGKSDTSSTTYDVLLFACRDIEKAFIPSSIKEISRNAFDDCKKLKIVEFSENSQLHTIGSHAFAKCSVEKIKLPSSVMHLKSYCFSNCKNLKAIEISEDSQLLSIDLWAFMGTAIKTLYIPPKLECLKDRWFDGLNELENIIISPENKHFGFPDEEHKLFAEKSNINSDHFDILHFAYNDIENVEIPSSIRIIKTFSFSLCKVLKNVTFPLDSELEIIENDSFYESSLEEISLPSKVKFIGIFAFADCQNLRKIELPQNSEVTYFSEEMIGSARIRSFTIPSKVRELQNGWCSYTSNLVKIDLSDDNKFFSYLDEEKKVIVGKSNEKIDVFDTLVFVCRDVKKVTIPLSIKYISSFSFFNCPINYIKIPKSVVRIENNAFNGCKLLKKIDFDEDSDEISIDEYCFRSSLVENIVIPSKKVKIDLIALLDCKNLSTIEFLGDDILFDGYLSESTIMIISMPNANTFIGGKDIFCFLSSDFILYIQAGATFK